MKTSLFLGTALTALLVTGMASAAKHTYSTGENNMDGANEKPDAVNSALTGTGRFTYDDVALTLCGHITLSATTDVTAAHIHPGDENASTSPSIDFGASGMLKVITVNQAITADKGASLAMDNYVNVHTTAHTGGEIRAQLLVDDNGDADETCDTVETDAGVDSGTTTSSSTSSSGTTTTPSDGGTTSSSSSGTSGTADSTDSGGCNTSGSNAPTYGALIGLGLVVAAVSRKRKKA